MKHRRRCHISGNPGSDGVIAALKISEKTTYGVPLDLDIEECRRQRNCRIVKSHTFKRFFAVSTNIFRYTGSPIIPPAIRMIPRSTHGVAYRQMGRT